MIRKLRLLIKQCIICLLGTRVNIIDDAKYNSLIYRVIFGRWLDLDHPKTFNEHIIRRKVYLDEYELWMYTDKYEVRKYVEQTVGLQYLNPLIGIYDSFDAIDFSALPERFALKGTHGSGYNIVVPDKNKLNKKAARRKFSRWLSENYYFKSREKNYFRIKPRIMCDAYIDAPTGFGLPEFKVFCFNGIPRIVAYNMTKDGRTFTNTYTADGKLIDVKKGYERIPNAELPGNFDELIDIARVLAQPFPFVRVDLYNVDGRIIFSELTFHSGGGFVPFTPQEYDVEFGHFFDDVPMIGINMQ